jgi:5-methylthioribose kinase
MLEITVDNALDYLRGKGWIGPGAARVELLGGGVSNIVLRVETANQLFVLKQSRPQLRTRDAWFSDLERVYREQEVMQALHPLLPAPTVPEVLFTDRDNFVFAMSHAPAGSRVWKEQLLAGEIDLSMGERAGAILGRMHEATARDPLFRERFSDPTVFVQLRADPFYRRVQERCPEVAGPVGDLIEQMLTRREALCHGDYTPKNMLVHGEGFTLVDYETAYFGDPAMDLGLFLAHLILKALHLPRKGKLFRALVERFGEAYFPVVTFAPSRELERRGIAHLGACLLARIDGTSPADYLPQEDRRLAVRDLSRGLLRERPDTLRSALDLAEAAWKTV